MAKKLKKPRGKAFVLDCSVTLAWCFPSEKAPYPQAVLHSLVSATAFVPPLWYLEVANALLMGERRQRSTEADTTSWLGFLMPLPITVDDQTIGRGWSDVLHLARAQDLSAYDAAYLELALRHGLPMATLDSKLKAAAATVGVPEYKP
jgi:predicted nucleic acid-binding protein